jgi:hypothetical protein
MRINHEALWVMPIAEAEYGGQYWEYYGEKFGWEEVITREVDRPQTQTEYDEDGNETPIYYQGSSYLRSEWRPREKREENVTNESLWRFLTGLCVTSWNHCDASLCKRGLHL